MKGAHHSPVPGTTGAAGACGRSTGRGMWPQQGWGGLSSLSGSLPTLSFPSCPPPLPSLPLYGHLLCPVLPSCSSTLCPALHFSSLACHTFPTPLACPPSPYLSLPNLPLSRRTFSSPTFLCLALHFLSLPSTVSPYLSLPYLPQSRPTFASPAFHCLTLPFPPQPSTALPCPALTAVSPALHVVSGIYDRASSFRTGASVRVLLSGRR